MRILFLTHRLPYAPNRGDRVRAYHLLRLLSQRADVDLLSLVHDEQEAAQAGSLRSMTTSVTVVPVPRLRNVLRTAAFLPTSRPATHTMLDSPTLSKAIAEMSRRRPDVVLAYCSGIAKCAFWPELRDIPLVLDMVDVDSAKWHAMSESHRPPMSWVYAREARVLSAFEARAAFRARTTMVVTDRERATMELVAPGANVEVVPNGVDAAGLRPSTVPNAAPAVVFCGVMNYAPNEEGVVWFAREVWPSVRTRYPDALFQIVGLAPTERIRALEGQGITVVGAVPDVKPYLWQSAVSVAPLLTARGVQNKVLEAVAAGLPTVVTPVVAEGVPQDVLAACRVASSAESFAEAVVDLLARSPEERRRLASSVDLANWSWERTLSRVYDILAEAAA